MDVILNEYLVRILKDNKKPVKSLSTRIVLDCSAVLLGCKPASTIMFNKQGGGREILTSWDKYKEHIFKGSKLRYFELLHDNERVLVLLYDSEKLEKLLGGNDLSHLLNYLGYGRNLPLSDRLHILQQKFSYSIPHEIGIFLGLPLKDVLSFMGLSRLSYSCTMGWKMYGNTEASISLYKHYKDCKTKVVNMLINGEDPRKILRAYPMCRIH